MPFFLAGPPKVHSGISGRSVFVALNVGHKITYLTPQCAPQLVTTRWSTLTYYTFVKMNLSSIMEFNFYQ